MFLGEAIEVAETEIDLTEVLEDASEDTTNSAEIQSRQYILVNCVFLKYSTKCFIINVSAEDALDAEVENTEADI